MILRLVDARIKTCPFTMNATYEKRCTCIADYCMAWRWADESEQDGFCGLGGMPYTLPTQVEVVRDYD